MSDYTDTARQHAAYATGHYANGNNEEAIAAALVSLAHSVGELSAHLRFPAQTYGDPAGSGYLCPLCSTVHPLLRRPQQTEELA